MSSSNHMLKKEKTEFRNRDIDKVRLSECEVEGKRIFSVENEYLLFSRHSPGIFPTL